VRAPAAAPAPCRGSASRLSGPGLAGPTPGRIPGTRRPFISCLSLGCRNHLLQKDCIGHDLYPWVKYGVRSLKFIWVPVYSCTHWLRRRNPPPPPQHLGSYTRALLVSQDRRHLFVKPLSTPFRNAPSRKTFPPLFLGWIIWIT
jgi:hypothetical protein